MFSQATSNALDNALSKNLAELGDLSGIAGKVAEKVDSKVVYVEETGLSVGEILKKHSGKTTKSMKHQTATYLVRNTAHQIK